ncbi:MAG: response regulator [Deltaproteobacteria bacterium]|nr:response regulator [Deltaproteobacteria bacterium]
MSAGESFEASISQRNVRGARLGCMLVAILMPVGTLLDLVTQRDKLGEFLLLRLCASAFALVVLLTTRAPWARKHAFLLGAAPAIFCAAIIEVMVEALGGYSSPYYAGLNLCILGVGLVFTWRLYQAALVCVLIIAMWLIPPLMGGKPIDLGPFFNNLYFLILTSVIAVASNESRYTAARREHDARMQLAHTTGELCAALDRLQELDRVKSQFFASISHELRTPLTLILAPVEELIARTETGAVRDTLLMIRRNAERLLRLIDDLLDLARLEAGGLRLQVGPVDLRALAAQVVEACRPTAEAKRIELGFHVEPGVEGIHGDPHRLEMVLTNLIGNALKFTPQGGRIRVTVCPTRGGASVLVSDNGPGIAEADLPFIFDRFYQADGGGDRAQGGVGIGLALAKELTELHEGTLSVESELGVATTFTLWLPKGRDHFRPEVIERRRGVVEGHLGWRSSDSKPHARGEPTPLRVSTETLELPDDGPLLLDGSRRPRIVVAEDQDDLRAFVRDVLSEEFDVLCAADGEEALVLVKREVPDLVLSDVMMPGKTGTELCREIKNDEALKNTPVILLTARVGSDAALEGYAIGADDYVIKPFHARVLVARIRAQLRLRALGLKLAAREKLAAVGTLAAGVAHEVRNPVNAIINAAQVLRDQALSTPATKRLLEVIMDAGERISSITSALTEHARPAEAGKTSICDVRAGLDATLRLLEFRMSGVEVEKRYESDRMVVAPPGELNQVFLNLLDNALRANARHIRVQVADQADRVVVRIGDDGPGVPQGVVERIFDPFFTTRAPGEGTGLGLFLSQRIVKKHGGDLRLERSKGTGAVFAVELPAEVGTWLRSCTSTTTH